MRNLETKVAGVQVKTVHSVINLFLKTKALKSENTAEAYETDIRQFFRYARAKELEQLTWNDIDVEHTEVLEYQLQLKEEGKANSTINRKITSLHTLYKFLQRDNHDIRAEVFNVDKMSESRKNSYGALTIDEVYTMIELVKKQVKGEEKALLIELAMATSIRKEALLAIKWDDITYDEKGVWVITVIGKGEKKSKKPIPDEFYQRLLVLKNNRKAADGYVFHLDSKTPDSMIRMLCDEIGIPESRNIVFHSLKKVTINWTMDVIKDLELAAIQGDHTDINTTRKYYRERTMDYTKMPGIMIYQQPNEEVLDSMSKEDLLELIKSASNGTKYELLMKAKKDVK